MIIGSSQYFKAVRLDAVALAAATRSPPATTPCLEFQYFHRRSGEPA